MKRISVTGWVPKNEKESVTLRHGGLDRQTLKDMIEGAVYFTKEDAIRECGTKIKRVRITCEVDVEEL